MAAAGAIAAAAAGGLCVYSCARRRRYRRREAVEVAGWEPRYDVHVARTAGECDAAVQAVEASLYGVCEGEAALLEGCPGGPEAKVLGLDCEWVGAGRVAVLQVATHDTVAIFQLFFVAGARRTLPDSLRQLLARSDVYKTGAAIDTDVRRLARDYGAAVAPWVCVQRLVADHAAALGAAVPKTPSLKGLAAALCGIALDKAHAVRCSGWEAAELSPMHVAYAAADAVASREVAMAVVYRLQHVEGGSPPASPARLHEEMSPTRRGARGVVVCRSPDAHGLDGAAGRQAPPSGFTLGPLGPAGTEGPSPSSASHGDNTRQDLLYPLVYAAGRKYHTPKPARAAAPPGAPAAASSYRDAKAARSRHILDTRTTPAYSNCLILAPDNAPLVCCDDKKADWYVAKGRAEVVETGPPRKVIRLLFEPVGRNTVAEFVENRCVVCGREEALLKHHVVPMCYRKEFPRHRKDHQPHDVLLLCKPCSLKCQTHYSVLRKNLEAACGVVPQDRSKHRTRAAAGALLMLHRRLTGLPADAADTSVVAYPPAPPHGVMSAERFDELASVLRADGHPPLRVADLHAAIAAAAPPSSGKQVCDAYTAEHGVEDGVTRLTRAWRQCFVTHMRPQYLPQNWSVDAVHVDERLRHLAPGRADL